jgi:hypothetical protein
MSRSTESSKPSSKTPRAARVLYIELTEEAHAAWAALAANVGAAVGRPVGMSDVVRVIPQLVKKNASTFEQLKELVKKSKNP